MYKVIFIFKNFVTALPICWWWPEVRAPFWLSVWFFYLEKFACENFLLGPKSYLTSLHSFLTAPQGKERPHGLNPPNTFAFLS